MAHSFECMTWAMDGPMGNGRGKSGTRTPPLVGFVVLLSASDFSFLFSSFPPLLRFPLIFPHPSRRFRHRHPPTSSLWKRPSFSVGSKPYSKTYLKTIFLPTPLQGHRVPLAIRNTPSVLVHPTLPATMTAPKKMTRLTLKSSLSGEYLRGRAKRPRPTKGVFTLVLNPSSDSEISVDTDVGDSSDISDIEDIIARQPKKLCGGDCSQCPSISSSSFPVSSSPSSTSSVSPSSSPSSISSRVLVLVP
ncbi:MAG: hypothetical protein BYD32DRAFT_48313 [Podila humilis]|nr:MAG: hypothetical protein BYD32DRAFT_48313 [Podila humilis]